MNFLSEINFNNIKNVGIRVDFNVPVNDQLVITDDTRLIRAKETINFVGCASPGNDPNIYKPLPKQQLRTEMGIDPNCFIAGTVMRNQKRKLFFELMKSFRLFLDQAPTDIGSKSFLYLHTSYPEKNGWDIPDGIMQNNLGGKVLMTYICKNCRQFFPSLFKILEVSISFIFLMYSSSSCSVIKS